ncbi:MAG TPA: mechanosensitive ion channel domain-containing protein, partial [Longimicrobiales bacterium]|nr:mechanosensitive ion channel domain-containing protein [Longimicrobiales bacterium]
MDLDIGQALNNALQDAAGWLESLVRSLPEFVAAVLVVVLFAFVAKGVRAVVQRLMDRATDHGPVKSLVAKAAYLAVLAAGVFVALGILQLDKTVTSLLAGVGILGLALGFAFQDIAENFIAGILITVRRPFTDGDLVETNGFLGHVETVDLRATHIRTLQGQLVRVPNGDVFDSPITNYTQAEGRRVD